MGVTNRTTAFVPACALFLLCGQGGCVNGDNPLVLVTFDAPHRNLEMVKYRYCELASTTGAIRLTGNQIRNDANAEAEILESRTRPRTEDEGLSVLIAIPHDCFDGFLIDQDTGARAAFSFVSLRDRGGTFPSSLHITEAEWE